MCVVVCFCPLVFLRTRILAMVVSNSLFLCTVLVWLRCELRVSCDVRVLWLRLSSKRQCGAAACWRWSETILLVFAGLGCTVHGTLDSSIFEFCLCCLVVCLVWLCLVSSVERFAWQEFACFRRAVALCVGPLVRCPARWPAGRVVHGIALPVILVGNPAPNSAVKSKKQCKFQR